MAGDGQVTGWQIEPDEGATLLERFPPEWPDVIVEHVTLDSHAGRAAPLPGETSGEIVGGMNDEAGLQAMVVAIDGATARPDGGTYHVTWSLDRATGRASIESNEVIADHGWRLLDDPIPITLIPARF